MTSVANACDSGLRVVCTQTTRRALGPASVVAVRSSATGEDGADASFAGMNATLTNITGEDGLIGAVVRCWMSLFSPRVITYRASRGFTADPSSGLAPEYPFAMTLARRSIIAGNFPNAPNYLVQWIRTPDKMKPKTAMPDLGLTEQQARDAAAYLYTLQ